jgi:hypothetical protein
LPTLPTTPVCTYAEGREEECVLRKLQRGLNSAEMRFEYRNIEINEENTQGSTFPKDADRLSPLELSERNIPFANSAKYLGWNFPHENYMKFAHRSDGNQDLQNDVRV